MKEERDANQARDTLPSGLKRHQAGRNALDCDTDCHSLRSEQLPRAACKLPPRERQELRELLQAALVIPENGVAALSSPFINTCS